MAMQKQMPHGFNVSSYTSSYASSYTPFNFENYFSSCMFALKS